MATFKHISSKNADYGAAEKYLTFAHDEFSMKPTLDENGRLIPREDYRISTLNCGDEDFAIACMRANLRYGKNQKREDVKSHHYIISFDPRDGTDNGLTVDHAQQLGEEFCKTHFRGHQAIVCTHPDGHNHSGNIHIHIVINGLLLNRTLLSQKSGWVSDDGNVYVIYTIKQMADDLNRSERTVKTALNELENAGLITRVRQGWNRANRIFLKLPEGVQLSSPPEGNICPLEVQDSSPCMGQNLPRSNNDKNYTDISQTEKGEIRHRYGQYQNVFLSEKQIAELESGYSDHYAAYIEKLSSYMETSGRHYANHYAAIRKWLDEDTKAKSAKNYDSEYTDKGDCL